MIKTARTNRLTAQQQQQWWADNADLLKRDRQAEEKGQRPAWGASEISGLSYMDGETAPKAKNSWGYDLDEWYRGDWSPREAAGKMQGYEPQGLIQTTAKDKRDRNIWLDDTAEMKQERIAKQHWMMTAKGYEQGTQWKAQPTSLIAIQRGGEWMTWDAKATTSGMGLQSEYPTWADTRGDLAMNIPSWMGQPSPLNWKEQKEANRCLAMPRRIYADCTWTLEEAEPLWWNRNRKGSILAGDIGAARIASNKYGKKIAALDKQLKAALADKGRRSHGPCIQMSLIYPDAEAASPADLISDNTDEQQRGYQSLKEYLREAITEKEMETLKARSWGMAIKDRHMLKRAQTKARKALG